jgi:hypothetical protein
MTREQKIRRTILAALKDCSPFLEPQASLFADANLRMPESVSKIEFCSALAELKGQKRVLCIEDEDGNPKWKITDNGLARLAELHG